eukprot:11730258-Alexandrium_andersonii.AAC.1
MRNNGEGHVVGTPDHSEYGATGANRNSLLEHSRWSNQTCTTPPPDEISARTAGQSNASRSNAPKL